MRSALALMGILFVLAAAAPAARAQTSPAPPSHRGGTHFIDMREYVIDGARKAPTVMMGGGRKPADFRRIMRLRRSFVDRLQRTAREAALR